MVHKIQLHFLFVCFFLCFREYVMTMTSQSTGAKLIDIFFFLLCSDIVAPMRVYQFSFGVSHKVLSRCFATKWKLIRVTMCGGVIIIHYYDRIDAQCQCHYTSDNEWRMTFPSHFSTYQCNCIACAYFYDHFVVGVVKFPVAPSPSMILNGKQWQNRRHC